VAVPPRSDQTAPLILVVDDNLDAREMYAMYLQYEGFRVSEAQNGQEAVERTRADLPSLVLMDASMPRLDGWDAVKQLKADPRTSTIPVLMLTGHAYDEHREKAAAVGADGFLAKPILPDQLAREVRRFLHMC
jgi:chemosensory pili system protein ChpA (sensor histidine kinase/response regulator)